MLEDAFEVVSYALNTTFVQFYRLYEALDLNEVFLPLVLLVSSYSLFIRPMLGYASVARSEASSARKKAAASRRSNDASSDGGDSD